MVVAEVNKNRGAMVCVLYGQSLEGGLSLIRGLLMPGQLQAMF